MADQEARKTSMEGRGLTVVTTSGAIVTILFGLTALVTKGDGYRLASGSHGPLGIALVFFALAAVFGVLTNAPMVYENVNLTEDDLWRWWEEPDDTTRQRLTGTRFKIFKVAQRKNGIKGNLLIAAVVCQVVAIGALAWSVGAILNAAP